MRKLFTTLPAGFSESVVAGGLGQVTSMDLLPDGRLLVAQQNGILHVVKDGGQLLPTPFLQLTVDSTEERGLLGVVHDPNFQSNHFIYVYHTVPAANGAAAFNELSRFTADSNNPDVAEAGSEVDILKLNDLSGATNHNGGDLHFGVDGMLYIGVGENANPANSQTLSTLLGKVLRIDVSQTEPGDPINDVAKLVPADNPFVSQTAGSIGGAIYALGFRNPFTFAVQPVTGKIFINDVGQDTWEEIDELTAGANYGWNLSEGFANPNPPAGLGPGVYQDPQLAYNHTGGPAGGGVAIVGGTFMTRIPRHRINSLLPSSENISMKTWERTGFGFSIRPSRARSPIRIRPADSPPRLSPHRSTWLSRRTVEFTIWRKETAASSLRFLTPARRLRRSASSRKARPLPSGYRRISA